MFLKIYKLWLMSWKAYLKWHSISFHPLSKHQWLAIFTFCCNIQEEKLDIFTFPLTSSVSKSNKKILDSEEFTCANRWFCPCCNDLTNNTKEIKFIKVGAIMIFQLEHYIMFKGNPVKYKRKVKCSSDPLKIPGSCENTVSFSASFSLQATINHFGIMQAGNYWSFKRDKHTNE